VPAAAETKPRCGAQLPHQPQGRTCRNVAGFRTPHLGVGRCYRHGGLTASHQRAAEKEIARQAVLRFALATEDEIRNLDPRQVLAEELARSQRVVRALDARINELAEIHGPTFHSTGIATGEAKPHVEWMMWADARAHLKAVAAECHRAGIEAFYARLAQEDGRQIVALLAAFAEALLGLSLDRSPAVRRVLATLLRQASAGAPYAPDQGEVVAARGEIRAALACD